MKNQGFIVFLTIIVTLLCLYYLSFTFVSRSIQKDAIEYATDASGNIDFARKQAYLDSVWNEPVYHFLGAEYTYKEVKETELSLGLDLQGGMHVTLEVSPVDIIKGLSGNNDDPDFLAALKKAEEMQRHSQDDFVDLFVQAYREIKPDGKLAPIFANAANRDKGIGFQSSDEAVIKVIKEEVRQAIDRSFNILRTRIDRFGTSQPNIQQIPGTGRIQIELPGVENRERVRKLLQGVAKLEFWPVLEWYDESLAGPLAAINRKLAEEEQLKASQISATQETGEQATETQQTEDLSTLLGTEGDSAVADDQAAKADSTALDSLVNNQVSEFFTLIRYPQGLVSLKDTSKVNRILKRIQSGDLKGLLPTNIKFLWDVHAVTLENGEEVLPLYAIKMGRGGKPLLTGEVVTDARQSYDERMSPAVSMSMNSAGARAWKRITGESIGKRIAIALDDYVQSAPTVNSEIPNGQSIITGKFTLEEAQDLANVLKAGALPARTRIVEEAVIGPTLGKEAQSQGVISIVAGLAIVMIFMVFYYYKGGLVANVALLFNIFFILGILAQLNAALTLPGIAGIVLTIGMSIDANVLIFERIREELRNGATLLKAISIGYSKAYSSIIDANVTTFIVGVILFVLGQGPVKGFATTLMIGIVSSFFSAVFITRVIITWMTRKKGDKSDVSFDTKFSRNWFTKLDIDFLGKRRIAYMISGSIIVTGMILVILEGGLNYGVDFTGGRSYIVAFSKPVVASDLKVDISKHFENTGTEVKTYGSSNVVKVTTSYLVYDESSEADNKVENALIQGIEEATGLKYIADDSKVDDQHFTISGSSKVGATIADDIKSASLEAIIFSLIAIFLYILIRFKKWQFSLGAIVALFHDVLFVIAAFAIARLFGKTFEVDQVFIAAMLTIIGYSINDTVVVFDRIRENLAVRPHEKLIDTFNLSINTTMNRTLITSFTTLIVVLILLIFGGEVLRGFSFALFVGIIVGTYSSIFIASPVVIDLSKSTLKKKGSN